LADTPPLTERRTGVALEEAAAFEAAVFEALVFEATGLAFVTARAAGRDALFCAFAVERSREEERVERAVD